MIYKTNDINNMYNFDYFITDVYEIVKYDNLILSYGMTRDTIKERKYNNYI